MVLVDATEWCWKSLGRNCRICRNAKQERPNADGMFSSLNSHIVPTTSTSDEMYQPSPQIIILAADRLGLEMENGRCCHLLEVQSGDTHLQWTPHLFTSHGIPNTVAPE